MPRTKFVTFSFVFLKLEEHFLVDVGLILVTFGGPGVSILANLGSFGVLEATLGSQSKAKSSRQL